MIQKMLLDPENESKWKTFFHLLSLTMEGSSRDCHKEYTKNESQ
jgi:hypothetical protein